MPATSCPNGPMQTSTLEGNSLFFQALNGWYVTAGLGLGLGAYVLLMEKPWPSGPVVHSTPGVS